MGEISDDIVEGACCQLCNAYFEQDHGYPVVCPYCYDNLSDADKKNHQKAIYQTLG